MHNYLKKKYYFISKFDTINIDIQDKQTIIIYRNYLLKRLDKDLLLKLKNYCKKKKKKIFLSNNIKMAIKLDFDGAYIPAFNKSLKHLGYSYNKKFKLIGSAHNLKEIRIKEKQKVDNIFLSSLFKKNKNYLGINRFKLLSNYTKKKIVVLGGISKKNLKILKLIKNPEFAGISYFE